MPTNSVYGGWAASGEIDIQEYRGQEPQVTQHTLHFGGAYPYNTQEGSGELNAGFDLSAGFHVYALEWDSEEIRWYLDDTLKYSVSLNKSFYNNVPGNTDPYTKNGQPFDQEFFMILNLAIAGNFFPSSTYGTFNGTSDSKTWTQNFQVDYVRVYQNVTSSSPTATPTATPSPTKSHASASPKFEMSMLVFVLLTFLATKL